MDTAEMALLVIAAEPRELYGILRQCRAVRALDWPVWYARSGELNRRPAALIANGPGFQLAGSGVEAALARIEADAVISTGFCGALDPELQTGEVFAADTVANGHKHYSARLPQAMRAFRTGRLASVDRVLQAEEKQDLAATGAAVVDMESAAVAECAARSGVPFYAVRAVLDRAGESFELDFNTMRGADGRFSRWKICAAALKRPFKRIPDLLRIANRGRLAANALGEFFGNCRF